VLPVRYELNLYMLCRRKYTASVVKRSKLLAGKRRYIVLPVRYELNVYGMQKKVDRLCGLVVRVPDYRSRSPCSIPGATRFF
jgi:hypothetical protein